MGSITLLTKNILELWHTNIVFMVHTLLGVRALSSPQVGGGNYVYFDTRSITEFGDETDLLYDNAYLIKEQISNGDIIVTLSSWSYGDTPPLAVCIDLNLKMAAWDESGENPLHEMTTLGENIAKYAPWVLDLPRLTEEEFYGELPKLPAMFKVRAEGDDSRVFSIGYDEGMTWADFIDSSYNTYEFNADEYGSVYANGFTDDHNVGYIYGDDSEHVKATDNVRPITYDFWRIG